MLWQYPLGPRYLSTFCNNSVLIGDSSSGSDRGITHFFTAQDIQPREWEKKNKDQTNNKGFGQLKWEKGGSVILPSLCIRRLTLTCILREISTKPRGILTHFDWSSLTATGPYLMPIGLFCSSLSTALLPHLSPTPSLSFFFPTPLWLAFPCPLPVASRSRAQAFVWFRAKTNNMIVFFVHPLHSVRVFNISNFSLKISKQLLFFFPFYFSWFFFSSC